MAFACRYDPRSKRILPPFWPHYVETSALPLRRRRCGKGFAYRDGAGKTISDKALKKRINQLTIPPAWSEVCIAADELAHIQAIGRDAEGRLQYR